ncbi:alpha-amylase family protein [Lactiplantibacillus plantarum]|uniref:alpha-amylase family glycosyl hydrolase n=1 Tax=Lactiplantibacillus plantarum TaxID=1590 RepID=UPI0021CB80D0|nr:alpha-amylase family glycosyl hydrolase [Lactiplantibacillus plantarum]
MTLCCRKCIAGDAPYFGRCVQSRGANSRYFNLNHTYDGLGASESPHSPYYNWFNFTDFPAKYKSWWGVTDLPTVDKNNTDYQQFIYGPAGVIEQWTQRGVDGWRLDVADELPDFFIHGIRQRLDQYPQKVLIGEVWEDASHKIAYNQRAIIWLAACYMR